MCDSSRRRDPDSPVYWKSTPATTSSGCDVVKRGCLYIKRPPTKGSIRLNIKTWQKKYLILRDDWKELGTTLLDIYDRESEASGADKKLPNLFFASRPYTIDLRNVVDVDLYLESRTFVHALVISRSNGDRIILGTKSELEMKCWMAAIKLLADKANQLDSSSRPPSCPVQLPYNIRRKPMGSNLNHSSPQLYKVAAAQATQQHHFSATRQMSSSTYLARRNLESCCGDAVEATENRHTSHSRLHSVDLTDSFTRMLSRSFLANFGIGLQKDSAGSKRKPSSKMSRKDSGFSESFDESSDQFQTSLYSCPDTLEEEDHLSSSSPPPIPPRQMSSPISPQPRTHEPWFSSSTSSSFSFSIDPPRPPPRPLYTLSSSVIE